MTALNVAFLFLVWVIESYIAERVRFLVWLTYIPQQPLGIPTLLLLIWSALARSRPMLLANGLLAVAFMLTFLGFVVPLGGADAGGRRACRLLTFNIHFGMRGIDRIARTIHEQNPDIVCLQETSKYRSYPDPSTELLKHFRGWHVAEARDVTTLSRHPLREKREHPMLPKMGRAALETRIELPEGDLTVFNVHYSTAFRGRLHPAKDDLPRLSNRALARWEQASILLKAVDAVEGPVVVAGDFNNPPRGLVYRRLTQRLSDAFCRAGGGFGYTFRSDLPVMRIDYIFTSRDIGVTDCRTIASTVSDHRLVLADLILGQK